MTDLFKWIATDLNQIISNSAAGSGQLINPDRIVTAGTSAGGYLSYLSVSALPFIGGNALPPALADAWVSREFMPPRNQKLFSPSTGWEATTFSTIGCFKKPCAALLSPSLGR